jgi:hypothetical protein
MSLAWKVFQLIQGSWKISRKIVGTGHLNGFAIFDPNPNDPNELFYSENGIFVFDDGNSLEASKKYIYRFINNDIYVYFNEKSSPSSSLSSSSSEDANTMSASNHSINEFLFHKFGMDRVEETKESFELRALHLCADDIYNVIYEFDLNKPQEFKIAYDVKGPKKNYVSQTLFQKKILF